MNLTPEAELKLQASVAAMREIVDDIVEQLDLVSRQNDIVIKYCRLIAEALSVREKAKQLDLEYERNKADLRNLRRKPRAP